MGTMWKRIANVLEIEDPGPMGLYLGCIHEEGSLNLDDGRTVRTMTFNQEVFFKEKIEESLEFCLDRRGKDQKLSTVTTPYSKESTSSSCARRPEKLGEAAGMCQWFRHAFALSVAEEAHFTDGKVLHCPWCDLRLLRDKLMEISNFSGQVLRTARRTNKLLPSLSGDVDEMLESVDYCGKQSRLLLKSKGEQMTIEEAKALKLAGSPDHEVATAAVSSMSMDDATNYALLTAARIDEDVRYRATTWSDMSDEDRLTAASASPEALYVEQRQQYRGATSCDDHPREYARKASVNKKKPTAKKVDEDVDWSKTIDPPPEPTNPPSMWKSGITKGKKPSSLCVPAASVLMGMLYGARMARYDSLRPVQTLATYFSIRIATPQGATPIAFWDPHKKQKQNRRKRCFLHAVAITDSKSPT